MRFVHFLYIFILFNLASSRYLRHKSKSICEMGPRLDPIFGYSEYLENCVNEDQSPRFQQTANSFCPSDCSETREVTLNIAAKKHGWRDVGALSDWSCQGAFKAEVHEIPSYQNLLDGTTLVFGSAIKRVDSRTEMIAAIRQVANTRLSNGKCLKIRFLSVCAHGVPGQITFHQGGLAADSRTSLTGMDCAFAPKAYINWCGCNLASGCVGDDFLMFIAAKWLSKGGKQKAFTAKALALGGLTFGLTGPVGLNLDNQYLTVDAGPSNPRWDNTPRIGSYCANELAKWRIKVLNIINKLRKCRESSKIRDMSRLTLDRTIAFDESLLHELDTQIAFENSRSSRVGFNSQYVDNFAKYKSLHFSANSASASSIGNYNCD